MGTWATTTATLAGIELSAGGGDFNSALKIGGTITSACEIFDGSSWATTTALLANRKGLASAMQQASDYGQVGGGNSGSGSVADCYEWSGVSWATLVALNAARGWMWQQCWGNRRNFFVAGGYTGSALTSCEKLQGVGSWATTTALLVASRLGAICGTQDEAIFKGGFDGPGVAAYKWNGSGWATTTSMDSAAYFSGFGNFNRAIIWRGAVSHYWDGISWATGPATAINRTRSACAGTYFEGISFAGRTNSTSCQKWTETACESLYLPGWCTTSKMLRETNLHAGVGSISGILSICGYAGGVTTLCDIYNGTSWATTTSALVARYGHRAVGTTSAAIQIAGYTGATDNSCEYYNGSIWATTTAHTTAIRYHGAAGSTSEAISFGGRTNGDPFLSSAHKWNGSTWATTTAMSAIKSDLNCNFGTFSDCMTVGGRTQNSNNPPFLDSADKFNGSTWATTGAISIPTRFCGGVGPGTGSGILAGGYSTIQNAVWICEYWNGTAWSTKPPQPQATQSNAVVGDGDDALSLGGSVAGGRIDDTWVWSRLGGPTTTTTTTTLTTTTVAPTTTTSVSKFTTTTSSTITTTTTCPAWPRGWCTTANMLSNFDFKFQWGDGFTSMVSCGGAGGAESLKWSNPSWATTQARPVNDAYGGACGATWDAGLTSGGSGGDNSYEWNGSAWGSTALHYAIWGIGQQVKGTQNDAIMAGGRNLAGSVWFDKCSTYNGVSWSTQSEVLIGGWRGAMFGDPTNTFLVGGTIDPGDNTLRAERRYGGSWMTTTAIPASGSYAHALGSWYRGRFIRRANHYEWNGLTWSTAPGKNYTTTGTGSNSGTWEYCLATGEGADQGGGRSNAAEMWLDDGSVTSTTVYPPTYLGYDILNKSPNWASPPRITLEHPTEILTGLGLSKAESIYNATLFKFKAQYLREDDDLWELLSFFDTKKGRFGVFWYPSWRSDIVVTSGFADSDITFDIEDIEYSTDWGITDLPGKVVFFWFPDGTLVLRTLFQLPSSTEMTLNVPLGKAISNDDLPYLVCGFAHFVRFDQDEIELQYFKQHTAKVPLSFSTVPEEFEE